MYTEEDFITVAIPTNNRLTDSPVTIASILAEKYNEGYYLLSSHQTIYGFTAYTLLIFKKGK